MEIRRTDEFTEWLESLPVKTGLQVLARIERIANHGHFGKIRVLGEGLRELKFKNGIRIYYCYETPNTVTLITGGNKNGQDKDVREAKKHIKKE